jgi:hypothetical protein
MVDSIKDSETLPDLIATLLFSGRERYDVGLAKGKNTLGHVILFNSRKHNRWSR